MWDEKMQHIGLWKGMTKVFMWEPLGLISMSTLYCEAEYSSALNTTSSTPVSTSNPWTLSSSTSTYIGLSPTRPDVDTVYYYQLMVHLGLFHHTPTSIGTYRTPYLLDPVVIKDRLSRHISSSTFSSTHFYRPLLHLSATSSTMTTSRVPSQTSTSVSTLSRTTSRQLQWLRGLLL